MIVLVVALLVIAFLICGGLALDHHGFDPWGM
jgi:hypothetical protein